jgi:hypothetical protein
MPAFYKLICPQKSHLLRGEASLKSVTGKSAASLKYKNLYSIKEG